MRQRKFLHGELIKYLPLLHLYPQLIFSVNRKGRKELILSSFAVECFPVQEIIIYPVRGYKGSFFILTRARNAGSSQFKVNV